MNNSYDLIPPSSSTLLFFGILVLLLTTIPVFFAWAAFKSLNTSVKLENNHLILDTALYGRALPISEIRVQEIKIIEINKVSSFEPKWRTNGFGLPGLQLGWFRLQNGEKALLALTNRKRVVYIPTKNEYSLIISVQSPEHLIASLKSQ